MNAWFMSLQPRERLILVGGGVVAVLIVAWAGVLRPMHRESAALRDSIASQHRLLADLGRLQGLGTGNQPAPRANEPTLMILVSNTAEQKGLTFPRTRPDGANAINVTFQDAPFDALLDWLIMLETDHGVSVETASFSGAHSQGLVSGQLLLRRN